MMQSDSRPLPRVVPVMLIGATCLIALSIVLVIGGRLVQGETVTAWAGSIDVETDAVHQAGRPLSVTVKASAPSNTPVQLAVFAPFSSTLFEQPLSEGVATFTIDAQLMQHAGVYQLVAELDGSASEPHQVRVLPGEPVDPVVPLVGPRTIIADGADITMIVVTPIDQFDNPVVNGTEVAIEMLRPSGDRPESIQPVERGIAALIMQATIETGRVTISASAGQADGPSNVVDQVAGVPASFTVQADVRNALGDGFTLHQVQTSELRDQFGNLLPDGVAAVFVARDGRGESYIHTSVQGGIARAAIEAPNQAGELTLVARVSGAQSAPSIVTFLPAVESVTASLVPSEAGTTLTIGPILTTRGGYVPDGTVVTVRDPATDANIASVALRGGIAQLEIDEQAPPFELIVLGASATIGIGDS